MAKVTLETNHGTIKLALDETKAPITVANFLRYVETGFYEGTIFHRVIPDFMIQGGGLTQDLKPKEAGAPIENEAANGLRNIRGSIAMARTNEPHSATAQFFINLVNNEFLNYKDNSVRGIGYAVFGRVTEGLDVLDKIAGVETTWVHGHENVPQEPVIIVKASMEPE